MTSSLLFLLAFPCLLWTQGLDTAPTLKAAGVVQVCVPPDVADGWRAAGFTVTPLDPAGVASREALQVPGILARPGLASPTRVPFVVTNGWHFARNRAGKYSYDVPARRGVLATVEAFAYGADAVVKIDPADVADVGRMQAFLATVPPAPELTGAGVADIGVIDDGSPIVGEVMNLLIRRNLLFEIVKAPSRQHALTIKVGSKEFPTESAADPSAFALKVRHQLTDERRSLRIYGSEVVIGHLTRKDNRARLHLINYGGRDVEGLRIRVRGSYVEGGVYIAGTGPSKLSDLIVTTDGATEFTMPHMAQYAVIDLTATAGWKEPGTAQPRRSRPRPGDQRPR